MYDEYLKGIDEVYNLSKEKMFLVSDGIKGNDLKINKLNIDTSDFSVEGTIDALSYSNTDLPGKKGKGLLNKIFK